jgi:hypothetical protein
MGVITNCCTSQSTIQSSISIYSLSDDDIFKNIENEIPTISDVNHAFKFITSKDYYSLLIKKIPKHIISKKICYKLTNNDIISLINNLFEWIKKEELEIDEIAKKSINLIKENAKISLNYILKEIKTIQYNDKIEVSILQSLTCVSLITQCLLYLANKQNEEILEYKYNLWENKNIIEEAKKYGFQAAYFLLLVKKKYTNNINNGNDKNRITNEKKEEVSSYYKISLNYAFDIINS